MSNLESIIKEEAKKVIFVDFNGTLTDDFPLFVDVGKTAFRINNGMRKVFRFLPYLETPSDEEVEKLREINLKDIVKYLLGEHNPKLQYWIFALGSITYARKRKQIAIHEGINDALNKFRGNGYNIKIVSSATKEVIEDVLDGAGVPYDEIYQSGGLWGKKRVYEKQKVMSSILEKEKLNPKQVKYIGDTLQDKESCDKLGLEFYAAAYGYNNEKAFRNAGVDDDHLILAPQNIADKILMEAEAIQPMPVRKPFYRRKPFYWGLGAAVATSIVSIAVMLKRSSNNNKDNNYLAESTDYSQKQLTK